MLNYVTYGFISGFSLYFFGLSGGEHWQKFLIHLFRASSETELTIRLLIYKELGGSLRFMFFIFSLYFLILFFFFSSNSK